MSTPLPGFTLAEVLDGRPVPRAPAALRELLDLVGALNSPRTGKTYGSADALFEAMGIPFRAA